MFLYCFAFISFCLVHIHEYLIPLNSDELCSDVAFMNIVTWIIPKLRADCELIETTLASHPYKDAAIVLGIWIFLSAVLSVGIGIASVGMKIRSYEIEYLDRYRSRSYRRNVAAAVALVMIFGFLMVGMLVFSTLNPPRHYSFMGTLWGHGLGSALQTYALGSQVFFFGVIWLVMRRWKSRQGEMSDER